MKKLIYFASTTLLICVVLISCGRNKPKNGTEVTKSDMQLSIVEQADPCGPSAEGTKLIIKNGEPFTNETAPYQIEAQYADGTKVAIELKQFVTSPDGTTSVGLILPGANNEDGDPVKFTVTDSKGIQTLDFKLIFCL